jgi:kynurenine formamidase
MEFDDRIPCVVRRRDQLQITPYLTREASRTHYAPGTEFAIDQLTLVGNTGTYLDAPYHRYRDGADLSSVPLDRTADLPAVVVRVTDAQQPGIDVGALAASKNSAPSLCAPSPACPANRR